MPAWPTQPPEENSEQARNRAELLRRQEAVTRWRGPLPQPSRSKWEQESGESDLPKTSTGGGSFTLPSLDREFFDDIE